MFVFPCFDFSIFLVLFVCFWVCWERFFHTRLENMELQRDCWFVDLFTGRHLGMCYNSCKELREYGQQWKT